MGGAGLGPGDNRTGLFFHGQSESEPWAVGSLWVDESRGVHAEIPYKAYGQGSEQFTIPARWFRDFGPIPNLVFLSNDLTVSLFGCRVSRVREGDRVQVGRIRAEEAVFAEWLDDVDLQLCVTTVVSHIEGLAAWSELSSIKWDHEIVGTRHNRQGRRSIITVESKLGLTWLQGAATMRILARASGGDTPERRVSIDDSVVLESRFREPRPILDHLSEHFKFRDLLALNLGTGAPFQSHYVRDRRFGLRMLNGKIRGAEYQKLIVSRTVAEHYRPRREGVERNVWAILPVEKVSPGLLAAWAKARAQAQRIVAPTVSVLGRSGLFVEDIVISSAMSVEALGSRLGPVANEPPNLARKRPTTANFFRAIATSGVDCTPIAPSVLELARALADIYNRIKHADRGDFPDGLHAHHAGAISLLIARLATIRVMLGTDAAVLEYAGGWRSQRLFDAAKSDRLTVNSGKFETLP